MSAAPGRPKQACNAGLQAEGAPASSGHSILIVEDEPKLARLLCDYLQAEGYACHWVRDGPAALPAIRAHAPALVVLDLMLPGRDGLSICRELRGFSTVPVVMVTARIDEVDRLLGLDVGADDYICKPYSPREVVARIKALLRRTGWGGSAPVQNSCPLHMDDTALRASLCGRPVDLTPVEFRLLRTLAAQPGRVFSRNQVLDRLHDDNRAVADRTVDSHVRNLRRKLTAVAGVDPIRSVYGVGYAFEWPAD